MTVSAGRVRNARPEDQTARYVTGWGTTAAEAAGGCRREADETFFAQTTSSERLVSARAPDLDGTVVKPSAIMLFGDGQYRKRARHNRVAPPRDQVPLRWQPERATEWLAADGACGTAPAWVPAGLCLLGHPLHPRAGLARADSNGLATGCSLDDAIVRGFCELVERDSTAIWWYRRLLLPHVARLAWDDLAADYERWLDQRGRALVLLDLTLDIPIPVVAALAHDRDGRRPAMGFAAGRSSAEATRHAVGELAQCEANLRLIERHVTRQGGTGLSPEAERLYRWHCKATVGDAAGLVAPAHADRPPGAPPLNAASCREMCRVRGLALHAVDLGTAGVQLARVLVPGLRPVRPRFAPGRLYDVPVTLGLQTAPTLNPTSFPY